MKYINSILMMLAVAFMVTSCEYDEESFSPGEQAPAGCQQMYFATNSYANLVELEPGVPSFDIPVKRLVTGSAGTVNVSLKTGSDVFVVPSSVSFDAGAADAILRVTFPNAEEGIAHKLTLVLEGDNVSPYTGGYREVVYNMTILKWENIGTGYYLDGTVSAFFGVDPTYAMSVEVQRAQTASSVRYRFDSPFAKVATAVDEVGGFNGYPFNDPADVVAGDYKFVIDVVNGAATLIPTAMGMDWGYGMFTCGTIYGYISTNSQYPLGKQTGDVIVFPANSLYISMADYNDGAARVAATPSYLYLSAKAYTDSLK
ncbi:hypothetical protein LJC35_04990 [Parabacteroides sp. OttesenSCG-928-N08]|nr:hypothetical protein [Parabacteroides sp. OttesenSCG-928-N08]